MDGENIKMAISKISKPKLTQQLKRAISSIDKDVRGDVYETAKEVLRLTKLRLKIYTQEWYDSNPENKDVYERTYDFINSIEGKVTQSKGKYYIKVYFDTDKWRIEKRGAFYSHAYFPYEGGSLRPIGEKLIDYIEEGFNGKNGTHAIERTVEWLEKYINQEFMKLLKLKIGKSFGSK